MKNKFILIFILALIFSSALNTLHGESGKQENVNFKLLVKNSLPIWIEMQKKANPKVCIEKFFIKGKRTLKPDYIRDIDAKEYIKQNCCWNIFDNYSPDSTKILNIYNYRYGIEKKNDKIIISEGGPDSKIELTDIKNNKIYRFDFVGTLEEYNDCFWIDNNSFIVATTREVFEKNGYFETTFKIYDLPNHLKLVYASNVYFKAVENYIKLRYPDYYR